jgi:hypothetical protein
MNLEPFRQGRLDGLCGVYSVINALRLAVWPAHRLGRESCKDLFRLLTSELAARSKLYDVLTGGSRHRLVTALLREADSWLRDEYEIRLHYRRPYRGQSSVRPSAIAATLARHLADGHASVIAGLTGSIEHWTVVRAVGPKTMLLFDSDDLKRLPLDPARRGHPWIEVVANELFLVRCECPRAASRRTASRQRS